MQVKALGICDFNKRPFYFQVNYFHNCVLTEVKLNYSRPLMRGFLTFFETKGHFENSKKIEGPIIKNAHK